MAKSGGSATTARESSLPIQVNPMELLRHGGAVHIRNHLPKEQSSFIEHMGHPEVATPEIEFALVNILAKMIEAVRKADPKNPEGVVLQAMTKNFAGRDSMDKLSSGGPVPPANPAEMQTPQFKEAVNVLTQKCKDDPPRRDALKCLTAASAQRPLTTNEVFQVFHNLADGVQLSPGQWQQVTQHMAQGAQLTKKDADEWNKKMGQNAKPTLMELANMVNEAAVVKPDGTIAPKVTVPTVHKADETMGMLELSRDFWTAFFKSGMDPKLHDDVQRQMAQLLRNVGAMYVKTNRRGSAMQAAMPVEANAHRFLIQKLRAHPIIRADRAKMAAVEILAKADETGRQPTPDELAEVFDVLGRGVKMNPDMLRAVLQQMITQIRAMPTARLQDVEGLQKVMASGSANPAEAIRVVNQATMQKPSETNAVLDLFANFFLAMHATKQNAQLRDQCQRMLAETLRYAGQIHQAGGATAAPSAEMQAYRILLVKLRTEVKADKAKARAVEELISSHGTGHDPTPHQLVDIFKDLGRGVKLTPEMLKVVLEHMCTTMRALTPNEKAEYQKRFKQTPSPDPTSFVEATTTVRDEMKQIAEQAQVVGCFQVFREGQQPAFGANRPAVLTTQSREVGMRAGPATVEWHRYKALGIGPPATEMARIVLVQSQLEDSKNFDDDKTQKTLMTEASDVTFRSVLQPSVMGKYQQSLKSDKAALSALQGLSQAATLDDKQLGKKVDQLLTTLTIDRGQLRGVLQQMVKDKLMTHDEARDVERVCEAKMAAGGGAMKLSDLQALLKARKGGR